MKKYLLTLLLIFGFATSVSAGQVDRYFDYAVDSEVNYLNLNGNLNNIINWANGDIDNINAKDGFNFVEVLGVLPLAGDEGRVAYLTTNDTLNFDNGTAWVEVPTYAGTAIQGDVLYFNGTVWARLAIGSTGNTLNVSVGFPSWGALNLAGGANYVTGTLPEANGGTGVTSGVMIDGDTAGGVLGGTYPDPTLGSYVLKQAAYVWDSDYHAQTEIVNFSMADAIVAQTQEFSYLALAVTLTNLTTADLVDGIVSRQCFDFNNVDEYALIATDASQAGMAALTLEALIDRNTAGGTDYIIHTQTQDYIILKMTDSNISGQIITGVGTELFDVAHGLSGTGINQEVHFIVAWDNLDKAEVYVNGVDVGDGDNGGNGTVSDSVNGIFVGANHDASVLFPGKIDGVRILNRKMGAAEVLARYKAFK